MKKRSLLGACLALPLAGLAIPAIGAQPGCEAVTAPQPAALQIQAVRMIASANVMFREMAAEMNAMHAQMAAFMAAPLPSPSQLVQAGFGPGLPIAISPGSGTVISIMSSGNGTCSETISYNYPANGGRPIIHVAQRGNACGGIHVNGPATVNAAQPIQRNIVPQPVHRPQLIEAEYQPALRRG